MDASLRRHLVPLLRRDGFTGSGRNFRRQTKHFIVAINVQGSRWGGAFAINLGIHPRVLPTLTGSQPDPAKFKEVDCEFRRRLTKGESDQWWEHGHDEASMDQAVQAAALVYDQVGRVQLERLSADDSPLFTLSATDMPHWRNQFEGFGSTDVRTALILARLRLSEYRHDEAMAFAHYGIQKLGPHSGLRDEFEGILNSDA